MLSYQHGYHAGNYADVIKHLSLTLLLDYLTQKDKPLLFLETHAGKGIYDLQDKQAKKTQEAQDGIAVLWKKRNELPGVFSIYIKQIEKMNSSSSLRHYPGSPLIAIDQLRPQDRIVCCELHPTEFDELIKLDSQRKHVFFENKNGLEQIKALLPPLEKRGLIFIDPSFEIKTDYKNIPLFINEGLARFATGVYCLWYPLVDRKLNQQLLRGLQGLKVKEALRVEFIHHQLGLGMYGCGLWIINPPYLLSEKIKTALEFLKKWFNPGESSYLIESY